MEVPQPSPINSAGFLNKLLSGVPMRSQGSVGRPAEKAEIRLLWLIVLITALICVVTIYIQLSTYPNHDVAWVLWGTRELLGGARWGVDIIEPNPPLAWYLSMPSTILAEWIGLPLDWTYRVLVSLLAALSSGCFAWSLRRNNSFLGVAVLCGAAGTCLLLLPGREFGQREHLAAVAVLPYLALASRRAGAEGGFSHLAAIAIGASAGIGIALKPYFIAVPVLVEGVVQVMGHRRASVFRIENLALGAVIAAYVGFLLLFEQEYLKQVVPLASQIYWSFDLPIVDIVPKLIRAALLAIPIAAYAIYRRDSLGVVLAAALSGFAVSYLIQHKGYDYHLLPVGIMVMILIAHFTISAPHRLLPVAIVALVTVTVVNARPTVAWWEVNRSGGTRSAEINRFRQTIETHSTNGRFLIVAVHPYPTFPVAIYTSAQQVSRTNSHWFLPAVVQIRANGSSKADSLAIERKARDFMVHDLSAMPGLVLIDRNSRRHTVSPRQFDFLSFFNEDPDFRRAWAPYREIAPIGSFRQFILDPKKSELPEGHRS